VKVIGRIGIPPEPAECPQATSKVTSETSLGQGALSRTPFYPSSQASQVAQGPGTWKRSGEDRETGTRNFLSNSLMAPVGKS
jgi:hypothetical protein